MALSFIEIKQRTLENLKSIQTAFCLNKNKKRFSFFKPTTVGHGTRPPYLYNRRTLLEMSSAEKKFKKIYRAHILAGNKSPVSLDVAIQNL